MNDILTSARYTVRVKWQPAAYRWLNHQLPYGESWWSLTCRDDPDYEIYLFVHEEDLTRFTLTWL